MYIGLRDAAAPSPSPAALTVASWWKGSPMRSRSIPSSSKRQPKQRVHAFVVRWMSAMLLARSSIACSTDRVRHVQAMADVGGLRLAGIARRREHGQVVPAAPIGRSSACSPQSEGATRVGARVARTTSSRLT